LLLSVLRVVIHACFDAFFFHFDSHLHTKQIGLCSLFPERLGKVEFDDGPGQASHVRVSQIETIGDAQQIGQGPRTDVCGPADGHHDAQRHDTQCHFRRRGDRRRYPWLLFLSFFFFLVFYFALYEEEKKRNSTHTYFFLYKTVTC
jgi:hypothetical protein